MLFCVIKFLLYAIFINLATSVFQMQCHVNLIRASILASAASNLIILHHAIVQAQDTRENTVR